MPTITINGLTLEAKEGSTVLQAAAQAGIEIPHYCYHPGLSVAGSCRMCQVEVAGMPKLQVACSTPVKDGMVVNTNIELVRRAQNSVLEFLLVNHPLDCPVCDQAGECGLQDYYMRYGRNGSRLADDKLKRQKAKQIGPNVMLDQDRCILCTRCVRFCEEIAKTSELGVFNRGDHSVVDIYPGRELTNRYSGNVVDICPVGALTDRDFRFQVRVWYLREGDSLCTGCSRGCSICVYNNPARRHHAGGRRAVRYKPRFNAQVNKWWMCDEGRYSYKYIDDHRLTHPSCRDGENPLELPWHEAAKEICSKLKTILDKHGPQAVAVLGSAQMCNEDLYLARKFFVETLGITRLTFAAATDKPGYSDNFLITADKNPNRRGALATGWPEQLTGEQGDIVSTAGSSLKALVVFRHPLAGAADAGALAELANKLELLVYIGTNECPAAGHAHYVLPAAAHVERDGTFTNVDGLVQSLFRVIDPIAEALPEWQIIMQWAGAMGIAYGHTRCESVFEEMSATLPAFRGLSYSAIGKGGQPLSA